MNNTKVISVWVVLVIFGSVLSACSHMATPNPDAKIIVTNAPLENAKEINARQRAEFEQAKKLFNVGNPEEGTRQLERLLDNHNICSGEIELMLGKMYYEKGRYKEAVHIMEPMVVQTGGAQFEIFRDALEKVEGTSGVPKFLDRNRAKVSLFGGKSLKDLNEDGLSDDQALAYLYTRIYDWDQQLADKADSMWQVVLEHALENHEYYDQYAEFLKRVGRIKSDEDLMRVYDDWYRKASPELKENIKKYYRVNYVRIDTESKP